MTLRSVAASAFLPAFVFEIGNGAIAPINAIVALRCGASPEVAAFMLALPGIGQVVGNIPASSLAMRLGDRRAMTLAAGVAVLALFGCYLARSLFVLGPALFVIGACTATYYLGRQAYLTEVMPTQLRARAMSTLGGSHRIGLFCGPFAGAALISLTDVRAAYLLAMGCAAAAALSLILIPDVDPGRSRDTRANVGAAPSLLALLRERRRLLLTLGTAVLAFSALRAVRQIVIPLWAVHIGLSAEKTSIIFGIASAVDMLLFYPAGKIMDRYGRLAIGIPSPLILGVSMALLPLTHSAGTLLAVAMLMSFGNGIGSGIQMTIGADLAPPESRIRFLSVWRVWSDTGTASGPVVLSVIASAATLGTGIVGLSVLGGYTAVAMARWLPLYSPFATPASVRARDAAQAVADDAGPVRPTESGAGPAG